LFATRNCWLSVCDAWKIVAIISSKGLQIVRIKSRMNYGDKLNLNQTI